MCGDNMFEYIIGKIVDIKPTGIVLDANNIGYYINVASPYSYELDSTEKVYIYTQIKEDEHNLFGFKNSDEKELFLKLIDVKGLGPKMALPILATGSIAGIVDAIERENILYLKKFPKIGDKLAKQIVLDLKGKINIDSGNDVNQDSTMELIEALKGLGYKEKEFQSIISMIDNTLPIELQIKEALKLLLK